MCFLILKLIFLFSFYVQAFFLMLLIFLTILFFLFSILTCQTFCSDPFKKNDVLNGKKKMERKSTAWSIYFGNWTDSLYVASALCRGVLFSSQGISRHFDDILFSYPAVSFFPTYSLSYSFKLSNYICLFIRIFIRLFIPMFLYSFVLPF